MNKKTAPTVTVEAVQTTKKKNYSNQYFLPLMM